MAKRSTVRSSGRYTGRRAALDPARAQRVGRRISSFCLLGAAGVGALLVAAAAGDPGALDRLQDQPYHAPHADAPLDPGIAALAARLQRAPDDPDGWALLARAYALQGDDADAAEADLHVAALRAHDPGQLARQAELRIAEAGGVVEPVARRLIEATLALDPSDVRARYLLGLAQAQDGEAQVALATWRALAADAPDDAPWRPALRAAIVSLGEDAASDRAAPEPPAATP